MWLRETNSAERKTLAAAFMGYGIDAFDSMIYTFMIPTFIALWGMTTTEAGYIATGALISSAVGGWLAGILADKYGRVRMLQVTVLWFSFFTLCSGFVHSPEQLLFTRVMQGLGFGGEWSVGSVLISEMIRARHRGKAVGLVQSSWAVGWAVAAIAYWLIYSSFSPALAWKMLFWVGALPALILVWLRRNLQDPEIYVQTRRRQQETGVSEGSFMQIFHPKMLRITLFSSLLATGMQGAYYAVTTWLPTFLKTERHLSVLNTSGYLVILIAGSFAGYLTSAWVSDAFGRRRCFILFALCAIVLVVSYTLLPVTNTVMMVLGFPLGFFLSGIFSGMGAYLSELYPGHIRGSGQGFCYNFGRAVGAIFPGMIGYMSGHMPLGTAIGYMAGGSYLLVIIACLALPETRGKQLDADIAAERRDQG